MSNKGKSWDVNYLTGRIPWDSNKVEKELVKFVKKYYNKKIDCLDVGCGTGINAIYLAKQNFNAVGVDISKVAIEIAKKKAIKSKVKCKFYMGDVLNLNFLKRKFDFVFDRGCFHHQFTNNRKNYANSIYNVLKKNGILLL